jgi:hypothetical protein
MIFLDVAVIVTPGPDNKSESRQVEGLAPGTCVILTRVGSNGK